MEEWYIHFSNVRIENQILLAFYQRDFLAIIFGPNIWTINALFWHYWNTRMVQFSNDHFMYSKGVHFTWFDCNLHLFHVSFGDGPKY